MSFIRKTFITAFHKRMYPNTWDVLALLLVMSVIMFFAWNARQMTTPYELGQVTPISLSTTDLPFYASRTVIRMLIALACSLLFTFVFGTWAAKSKRAERIIIPMIDVLQSVPILGFLSVTVAAFIGLFPGSMLGPECAAIFAIFTSQAWNMALGFYQTVSSVPAEVEEAAKMFHLNAWQRFWRIEVPYSMPGLLWNAMVSMSAGWFFVVAAEAITVSNQQILLPGIGSYIAVAIQAANLRAIAYAVITMFVVIILYDQLIFRPLVAWSDKFKSESMTQEKVPESWVINLFRRTKVFRNIGRNLTALFNAFVNIRFPTFWSSRHNRMRPRALNRSLSVVPGLVRKNAESTSMGAQRVKRLLGVAWDTALALICIAAAVFSVRYIVTNLSFGEIGYVFYLGLVTTVRVLVLIIISSIIWVPIGIWIGLHPRITQIAQPVAQILAAFPANLFYPFIVMVIVTYHLSPNIWLTPLMILGAQWYILFNAIAGASVFPKDLLQVTDNLGVTGWLRWKRVLLPGIFPYYVTGAITASGGAWNASIVAEVASWGNHKLVATGLGAYISEYTTIGSFAHTALGIGMMSIFVLVFNRLVWRPLYVYAENRFALE